LNINRRLTPGKSLGGQRRRLVAFAPADVGRVANQANQQLVAGWLAIDGCSHSSRIVRNVERMKLPVSSFRIVLPVSAKPIPENRAQIRAHLVADLVDAADSMLSE
jgi:hypothetical protein